MSSPPKSSSPVPSSSPPTVVPELAPEAFTIPGQRTAAGHTGHTGHTGRGGRFGRALSRGSDAPGRARPPAGFRPDIEGLRALAVLAVLAFHAAVPGLAGGFVGVDVFLVVSGYLITGLLLREATTTGRIRLGEFFSRRAHAAAALGRDRARRGGTVRRLADGAAAPGRPGVRRARVGVLGRQLAFRRPADRLPGRRAGRESAAALLVARRGGAVLPGVGPAAGPHRLPGAAGGAARPGGRARAGGAAGRGGARRRADRRLLRALAALDARLRLARLPRNPFQGLAVRGRRAAGPAALAPAARAAPAAGGGGLGRCGGRGVVRAGVRQQHPVPGLGRAGADPGHGGGRPTATPGRRGARPPVTAWTAFSACASRARSGGSPTTSTSGTGRCWSSSARSSARWTGR